MANHTDRRCDYRREPQRDDIAERMAFVPTAFEKKLRGDRRGRDDRREPRNDRRHDRYRRDDRHRRDDRYRRDDRREPLMTQTFAGIPNSIRGLAIGRKGAIQKLVTGRSTSDKVRSPGFVLDRYSVEDDTIPNHFKIIIRGTARDVLCAQSFIFKHILTSHKNARDTVMSGADVLWNYDNEIKSFVMRLHDPAYPRALGTRHDHAREQKMLAQANPHGCAVPPPPDTGSARPGSPSYNPTSPTYDPDAARPCTPPGPPPGAAANWTADADWSSPPPKHSS
jgi:hypothetical protein